MIKSYQKDNEYSYSFGGFATFMLLKRQISHTVRVLCHDKLVVNDDIKKLFDLANSNNVPVEYNSKLIEKISPKENTFVVGVFNKYDMTVEDNVNHVILVNPSDMGNMGTIMRTMSGFNVNNLCIIGEHADYFNPKVVRSSMGSIFALNIQTFANFSEYKKIFPNNACYPFMLDGAVELNSLTSVKKPYSLIFGNEGSGLDHSYVQVGQSVLIKHSDNIDSLNLPIACSIALYQFDKLSNLR